MKHLKNLATGHSTGSPQLLFGVESGTTDSLTSGTADWIVSYINHSIKTESLQLGRTDAIT